MMRNSPWNTDDIEILRQKWRLANNTATNCERLQHELELIEIRVAHVSREEPEHQELSSRTRKVVGSAAEQLFDSGLEKQDWAWFAENVTPDGLSDALEQSNICQQVTDLPKLIASSLNFVSAVAEAKRKFSDVLKTALNSKEEREDLRGTWFQEMGEGVQIYKKLIKLDKQERTVLLKLCDQPSRFLTYDDIAESSEYWKQGLASPVDKIEKTTKSNIRASLSTIRKALRKTFALPDEADPVKYQSDSGWRLDKNLLQENI